MTFFFALNSIWNVRALKLHSIYVRLFNAPCTHARTENFSKLPVAFTHFIQSLLMLLPPFVCYENVEKTLSSFAMSRHPTYDDDDEESENGEMLGELKSYSTLLDCLKEKWEALWQGEEYERDREIHMKRCEMTTFSLSFAIVLVRDHFTHFHSVERHCRLSSSRHCTTEDSSILPTLCEFHFFSCPFVSHFGVTFRVNIDVFLISLRYFYLNRSWCHLEGVAWR